MSRLSVNTITGIFVAVVLLLRWFADVDHTADLPLRRILYVVSRMYLRYHLANTMKNNSVTKIDFVFSLSPFLSFSPLLQLRVSVVTTKTKVVVGDEWDVLEYEM